MLRRFALYFVAPGSVEVREESVPSSRAAAVLVESRVSAISAGTELLVYRGLVPDDVSLDATIGAYSGAFTYPCKYGYAVVGRVVEVAEDVCETWLGRRVFAFHAHESLFWAEPDELLPVPDDITDEAALFLPTMETAVTFMLDAAPCIGERVVVFGQGVVGLVTLALLARFPLEEVVVVDRFENRLAMALDLGADRAVPVDQWIRHDHDPFDADLVIELSGQATGLQWALHSAGFSGRVLIGSWYGEKPVALQLGGAFHRKRLRIIGSQVSTIDPRHRGRWTKPRRFDWAWQMIREVEPVRLITHFLSVRDAAEAYTMLDTTPEECLQVCFQYHS